MKTGIFAAVLVTCAAMAGAASVPNPVIAQATSGNNYGGNGLDNTKQTSGKTISTPAGPVALKTVSRPATKAIVTRLAAASAMCRKLETSYYVDCLGERMEALSKELSKTGEYGDAQKVLADAAKKLRKLAKANQDKSKPRVRVAIPNSTTGAKTKRIVAIKPTARKKVRAEAEAIVAEAQTLLLRSANNSQKRKTHYQQIAAAVGSETKVLLRSL